MYKNLLCLFGIRRTFVIFCTSSSAIIADAIKSKNKLGRPIASKVKYSELKGERWRRGYIFEFKCTRRRFERMIEKLDKDTEVMFSIRFAGTKREFIRNITNF
jgi:hypothetical protein